MIRFAVRIGDGGYGVKYLPRRGAVLFGPVLSMKDLIEDCALYATGTLVKVDHPERGEYVTVGPPVKLSDNIVRVERSPLLGEHTVEVASELLGFDEAECRRLMDEKVFY